MPDDSPRWYPYERGTTIGQRGSEAGTIAEDQEHSGGTRITLERQTSIAPFAITCGLYGWFLHTRYIPSEEEARNDFEQMKAEFGLMIDLLSQEGANDEQVEHAVLEAISKFVERFPT